MGFARGFGVAVSQHPAGASPAVMECAAPHPRPLSHEGRGEEAGETPTPQIGEGSGSAVERNSEGMALNFLNWAS